MLVSFHVGATVQAYVATVVAVVSVAQNIETVNANAVEGRLAVADKGVVLHHNRLMHVRGINLRGRIVTNGSLNDANALLATVFKGVVINQHVFSGAHFVPGLQIGRKQNRRKGGVLKATALNDYVFGLKQKSAGTVACHSGITNENGGVHGFVGNDCSGAYAFGDRIEGIGLTTGRRNGCATKISKVDVVVKINHVSRLAPSAAEGKTGS